MISDDDMKKETPQGSTKWFNENLKSLTEGRAKSIFDVTKGNINQVNHMKMTSGFNENSIGSLYMFVYDPKFKDVLPKYDTFPLIILFDLKHDGFIGLNLHYLPALQRHMILNQMLNNQKKSISAKNKLILNYNMLQAGYLSPLKICYKRYLFSHVRSRMLEVPPIDWKKSVLLPTSNFVYNKDKK